MPDRISRIGFVAVALTAGLADAEQDSPKADKYGRLIVPVTIRGRAADSAGKPIAGAEIVLISANSRGPSNASPIIARTSSGADGQFVFRDAPVPVLPAEVGPPRKPMEGVFQVYGVAEGYGFTWHPQQRYRPEQDSEPGDAERHLYFADEAISADLVFEAPARLQGRVTDDAGEPIAGATVEIGHCADPYNPHAFGGSLCEYLGPAGAADRDRFSGIAYLPESLRSTVTDDQGRYEIPGLRRDTLYLAQIDYEPEYDPLRLTVATTARDLGGSRRSIGADGRLDHTFIAPRKFVVQVTSADRNTSVANVTIRARGSQVRRAGALGRTDDRGKAVLRLPPDGYTLILEPPFGTPGVRSETALTAEPSPRQQSIELEMRPAAIVLFEAVDASSGAPVAGVSFLQETDAGVDRREVHRQTVFMDYPTTDARGGLKAVVEPGQRRFLVGNYPEGYEPVTAAGELVELRAGQRHEIRFEFKRSKVAAGPEPPAEIESDDPFRTLRTLLREQRQLPKAGTARIQYYAGVPQEISPDQLRELLDQQDPAAIPDIAALLQEHLPVASFGFREMTVTADGRKLRNEWTRPKPDGRGAPHVVVFNGEEGIDYDGGNGQVSIRGRDNFQLAMVDFSDLCRWPALPVVHRTGQVQTRREDGRLILQSGSGGSRIHQTIAEQTGFLYRFSFRHADGDSGREVWQFAPQRTPSGVILAGLSIEFDYRQGKLRLVKIYRLERVDLESPLAPDAFVVSVPPGTSILDYRGGQRSPKRARVLEPVTDVLMRARMISDQSRSVLGVIKPGRPAPPLDPLAWVSADGPIERPDLSDKVVLVDFWGITCGPCVAQLPEVQALAKQYAGTDLVIVGLHEANATAEEVREFARERGLGFPLAIDRPASDSEGFGATFKAFGVRGIPNAAVIDRRGKFVFAGRFSEAAKEAARLVEARRE